jgi:thiamine-monophosphate kinase
MNEFELIARFFARPVNAPHVVQAGGDDCAVLRFGDHTLAITSDLLLEGRHFLPDVDPAALGHKVLAVNLSDLAAAGATPRCFLLALALPRADPAWLAAFSTGLYALADEHGCALVGGDTTRVPRVDTREGPLTVCITALGELPAGRALGRGGAQAGDDLWVSGTLGDAGLALRHLTGALQLDAAALAAVRPRLERPVPRVALGTALCGLATARMDVSDGLVGDARHIAARSGVRIEIEAALLPLGPVLAAQPETLRLSCALTGGDDYELLFTAAPAQRPQVLAAAQAAGTRVTRIGTVRPGADVVVRDRNGQAMDMGRGGYDHFASS